MQINKAVLQLSSIKDNHKYVYPGIIVGVTGNTGRSTGSHLHLTCKKGGKSVNPTILFIANSSPL